MLDLVAVKWLALPCFLVLASWFDWKQKRVPNLLNAFFFVAAVGLNYWAGTPLFELSLFVVGALAFAYLLYSLGAWGAGDAKFFAVLAAFFALFKGFDVYGFAVLFVLAALLAFVYALFKHEDFRQKVLYGSLSKSVFAGLGSSGAMALLAFAGSLSIWLWVLLLAAFWFASFPWWFDVLPFLAAVFLLGLTALPELLFWMLVLSLVFFAFNAAVDAKRLKKKTVKRLTTAFAPALSLAFALVVLL